jgi:hypothetical protein
MKKQNDPVTYTGRKDDINPLISVYLTKLPKRKNLTAIGHCNKVLQQQTKSNVISIKLKNTKTLVKPSGNNGVISIVSLYKKAIQLCPEFDISKQKMYLQLKKVRTSSFKVTNIIIQQRNIPSQIIPV